MKKQLISTILIGALLISLAGCSNGVKKTKNGQVKDDVYNVETQLPADAESNAKSEGIQTESQSAAAAHDEKLEDYNEADKAQGNSQADQSPADQDKKTVPQDSSGSVSKAESQPAPTSSKASDSVSEKKIDKSQNGTSSPKVNDTENAGPTQVPKNEVKASEYFNNTPATSIDTVQISPRHVYYKDSKLYMEAFVYNGFQHTIFDIRNIGLRISNKSGIIAEAGFQGLGDTQIAPNSYIVWTFIFGPDAVKQKNADLGVLKTEFSCDNSY